MKTSLRTLSFLCAFVLMTFAAAQESEVDESDAEEAVEAAEVVEDMEASTEENIDAIADDAAETLPAEASEDVAQDAQSDEPETDSEVEAAVEEDAATEADEEPPVEADAETQSEEQASSGADSEVQAQEEAAVDEEAEAQPEEAEPVDATASETFVLQGHPIFTPDQAELVYSPLVDYLNEATPYRFDLEIARDFHRYWLDIRRGNSPDLVLEDAHLTAYRINREDYTPLVKAAEPMTYSLLTSADNADATLQDLVGKPVSTMPSPSLGYLVLSSWYDNPMQQPVIKSNASSWADAIEIVFSMEAEAAIVPRNLVERYVNMVPVRTSREFPGLTLSASPNVPEDIQEEIRQALLVLHDDQDHYEAMHELDIDRFVEASTIEYEGLEEWLSQVITFF